MNFAKLISVRFIMVAFGHVPYLPYVRFMNFQTKYDVRPGLVVGKLLLYSPNVIVL